MFNSGCQITMAIKYASEFKNMRSLFLFRHGARDDCMVMYDGDAGGMRGGRNGTENEHYSTG